MVRLKEFFRTHFSGRKPKTEQCEICGEWLTFDKAVLISEDGLQTDDSGRPMGGWAMTATFCRRHDPRKANDRTQ